MQSRSKKTFCFSVFHFKIGIAISISNTKRDRVTRKCFSLPLDKRRGETKASCVFTTIRERSVSLPWITIAFDPNNGLTLYHLSPLLGFYEEVGSLDMSSLNQTFILVDPKLARRKKPPYSYIGPVLIGVGGIILVVWTKCCAVRPIETSIRAREMIIRITSRLCWICQGKEKKELVIYNHLCWKIKLDRCWARACSSWGAIFSFSGSESSGATNDFLFSLLTAFVLVSVLVATLEMRDMTVRVYPQTKIRASGPSHRKKRSIAVLAHQLPLPQPSDSAAGHRAEESGLLEAGDSRIKASSALGDFICQRILRMGGDQQGNGSGGPEYRPIGTQTDPIFKCVRSQRNSLLPSFLWLSNFKMRFQ